MSSQRVTAILVVHDGATWLPEVVASIASQSRGADQIVAIDTGSKDSSAKLLKGARIPVSTIGREIGFGAAIAYGVEQLPARIEGSNEWLWILHDDCVLHPKALESLLAAIVERPNVVMAGPKLLGWHNRTHLLEVGVSIASNGARWTGLENSEYDQGQHDGIHEVLAVSTAGALIRRDVFEELGGFDLNLELFRDDVDFGWRVRVAGHSVIVVTDAIGYHAQASATERRSVDVKGAFLHRPLLLDRRNAAYVLLSNSSWWVLPWLVLQLLTGALLRATGYLFAKLPGYASDELLAIASLIIHPKELLTARSLRKKSRFISTRVVKSFIPSQFSQLRTSLSRGLESLRDKIIPNSDVVETAAVSDLTINEDEDLLTPISHKTWKSVFTRPMVAAASIIALVSIAWTRHRLGALTGGALAQAPHNVEELFRLYFSSWHEVAMGSGLSTPVWILILATGSLITLGNVSIFITLLFLFAPFILLLSAHRYLKGFTTHSWLSTGASLLYALSPVAIASINSGRLGVIIFLALLPYFVGQLHSWADIETRSWRSIYGHSLFLALLFAFNPSVFLILIFSAVLAVFNDYARAQRNFRNPLFRDRLFRRLVLTTLPVVLTAPHSFGLILHPSRLLGEIGLSFPGGGPNLAILANPGGPGSLPWWCISPITAILVVAYFSTTAARKFAAPGIVFLLGGTLMSSLIAPGNGSASNTRVFAGILLSLATLLSITAAVVMFDKIRTRLEQSNINYRHISVAAVLILTVAYSATSIFWLVSAGSDSPLRNSSKQVLPAFLTVDDNVKTLVIRPYKHEGDSTLSYYLSRGHDVSLGEADVAPKDTEVISRAVEGLIDNTGVTSSKIFSTYGIKYIFLKNPASEEVVQTIDGLGGFSRTSATNAGIVWKVNLPTGRLIFTDYSGKVTILESKGVNSFVPNPGTLTLTENYGSAWQVFQDGYRMARIEDQNGLPTFEITNAGHISIFHDGTLRRGWISIFLIALVTTIVLALPAGRRKSQISAKELA
jgi:GT2 family glycosyltransferase